MPEGKLQLPWRTLTSTKTEATLMVKGCQPHHPSNTYSSRSHFHALVTHIAVFNLIDHNITHSELNTI